MLKKVILLCVVLFTVGCPIFSIPSNPPVVVPKTPTPTPTVDTNIPPVPDETPVMP